MKFNYLRHTELPYFDGKYYWSICPITGSLLKSSSYNVGKNNNVPKKVLEAIMYCNNPYLCKVNRDFGEVKVNLKLNPSLNKIHFRFLTISSKRFYLSRLYASLKLNFFENTSEALTNINKLPLQMKYKHKLCLQRSFLAAKISKSFLNSGVVFIGAFLPTGDMHAWIIENGMQPDFDDRGWINYRHLLALYY